METDWIGMRIGLSRERVYRGREEKRKELKDVGLFKLMLLDMWMEGREKRRDAL